MIFIILALPFYSAAMFYCGMRFGQERTDRRIAERLGDTFLQAHNRIAWRDGRSEEIFQTFDELYEHARRQNEWKPQ